jgi:predicted transcriptional regulator
VGIGDDGPLSGRPLDSRSDSDYDASMGKAKELELDRPALVEDDEDEETLAAIDEGIRDAEAGRTVPPEAARKLLAQWISDSSTRKGR